MKVPLFIPLKAEWFEAFESGRKRVEYRLYGPRWNHDTCFPGRSVVLSYGYGKARRLHGQVVRLRVVRNRFKHGIYPIGAKLAAISIRLRRK